MAVAQELVAQAEGIDALIAKAVASEQACHAQWLHAVERVERLRMKRQELEQRQYQQAAVDESAAKLRRAVRQLRRFTIDELAAEMDRSKNEVKAMVGPLMDQHIVIKTDYKFSGKPVFEWVKPSEAGKAFETQQNQRHLASVPEIDIDRVHSGSVSGTGRNTLLARITDKEVRAFVLRALNEGWVLADGGKHPHIKKGTRTIPIPSTPRNGANAVKWLSQQLQQREREVGS